MTDTEAWLASIDLTPTPSEMITPGREITGISAVLLPFTSDEAIDWESYAAHLSRTAEVGLVPAVNMDTGYVNRLDDETRLRVLKLTREVLGEDAPFVAGAFVADAPGDAFNEAAYRKEIERIEAHGGTPIIFQSYGMTSLEGPRIIDAYATLAHHCEEFIAFELGKMFAPFGRIYDLDTYARLLDIPECTGAKHSSLDRQLEWQRLILRNERRPDFNVFTGNDLAIDMVIYGSDYLLGITTFAPGLFAYRDGLWAEGNPAFYELNDLLQYLGFFAFRPPVPAYKHSAAQFLQLRGRIKSSTPHPEGARRPESDIPVLRDIAERLDAHAQSG